MCAGENPGLPKEDYWESETVASGFSIASARNHAMNRSAFRDLCVRFSET